VCIKRPEKRPASASDVCECRVYVELAGQRFHRGDRTKKHETVLGREREPRTLQRGQPRGFPGHHDRP